MASRYDIMRSLKEGLTPQATAARHHCNLVWVEIIAGKRIPESAERNRQLRIKQKAQRFIEWRQAA